MNVGVVLGDNSGGLVDVDLDCPEARFLAPHFLPETGVIFGRSGSPRSHWIYKVFDEPGQGRQFEGPNKVGTLVEYRANGCQTVFPPSVHESGEKVEFDRFDCPAELAKEDLLQSVSRLAAASLLAKLWQTGNRHNIALALSGALLNADWSNEEVEKFVEGICLASGDDEMSDRLKAVKTTSQKLASGEQVTVRHQNKWDC